MELFTTDEVVPYNICLYKGGKLPGKCNRDFTDRECEKGRIAFIVFKRTICINEMLDHDLEIKGEAKENDNQLYQHNLYFRAHNGGGFDSYVVLNNLL